MVLILNFDKLAFPEAGKSISMGVILFIVLVALALSLYDFFSSRDTNRLSAKVAVAKNNRYGAYAIRRSYNLILTFILLGFLVLSGAYLGLERGFGFSLSNNIPEKKERTDTFLLTINAPPVEHIETLPPSYKLNGKQGSGAPSAASRQQAEPPAEEKKPVSEKTPVDAGEKTQSAPEKPKTKTKYSSVEERIRAEEREMYNATGEEAKRDAIRKKAAEDKKKREEERQKKAAQQTQQTNQNAGGNNGSKGNVMVDWKLDGRTPHNNDANNIRNPGYTCIQGYTGKIVVKVKVNSSGNVTSAIPVNPGNLNPCLIEQAEKYARMSRFNASSVASQEGTITYVFAP